MIRYIKALSMVLIWYIFNNVYVFLDVGVNTLIGGHRDETISSRCGKGKLAGKPVHTFLAKIIDTLFFWEEDHCVNHIQKQRDKYAVSTLWDRYFHGNIR